MPWPQLLTPKPKQFIDEILTKVWRKCIKAYVTNVQKTMSQQTIRRMHRHLTEKHTCLHTA